MNDVIRRISLDLSRKSNVSLIFSSQMDMNSRVFLIKLFDDGRPYRVPSGVTAAINVLRSNGTCSAFIAEVTADGCVKYTAGSWALGLPGITRFSVSLYDGSDKKLTSSAFSVDIAPGLYLGEDINEDDSAQTAFQNMMVSLAQVRVDELARISAESKRAENEEKRETSENTRVENEENRIELISEMNSALDGLIRMQESHILGGEVTAGLDLIIEAQNNYINGGNG